MKRNKEKAKRVRECITQFYKTVSDNRIAKKFDMSVNTIAIIRRRLGLKKDSEIVAGLLVTREIKKIRRIGNRLERIEY